jgi:zinc protease
MFKGTKDVPGDQFKKIIIANGGMINAFTTPDMTAYTCDIGIEFLDSYLKLEADRMQNLIMEAKEVAAEQKVVLEERLMRLDNIPLGAAYEAMLRATYWYHPYGIPAIGYPQHIEAYTLEAAFEHYKTWYTPNNAILVIAGDITMEALKPMVEKHFGPIPSRPVPPRKRVQEPDHSGIVISLEQENPRVSQISIYWNYAAPTHREPNSKYFYPLIVLSQAMGGNDISRLNRALVEEQKIAVQATCSYESYEHGGLDPQPIELAATLAPGKDLVTLKASLQKLVNEVIETGITEKELADAKRDILAALAFARDGNSSSVQTFTRLGGGFTVEQIEDLPNLINAVTAAQVLEAAKFVFSKNPIVILTVYPPGAKDKEKKSEAECLSTAGERDKKLEKEPANPEKGASQKTSQK